MSGEDVTLVSSDGKEFKISRAAANHSGFLKDALSQDNEWEESEKNRVTLAEMPDYIVQKVCEYLEYREKYENKNTGQVPDFVDSIPKEIALELLMAADYLSC